MGENIETLINSCVTEITTAVIMDATKFVKFVIILPQLSLQMPCDWLKSLMGPYN